MEFLHRTWAEIDVDALVHNFGIIKKEAAGAKIMAVVKADAYGHSARNVAPLLCQRAAEAVRRAGHSSDRGEYRGGCNAARLRYNQAYSYFGLYAC